LEIQQFLGDKQLRKFEINTWWKEIGREKIKQCAARRPFLSQALSYGTMQLLSFQCHALILLITICIMRQK
jgi:hypothetical protein